MTQRLIETFRVLACRKCLGKVERAVVTYRNGKAVTNDPVAHLFLS